MFYHLAWHFGCLFVVLFVCGLSKYKNSVRDLTVSTVVFLCFFKTTISFDGINTGFNRWLGARSKLLKAPHSAARTVIFQSTDPQSMTEFHRRT